MDRALQDYRERLRGLPELRESIEEYEANNLIRVVLNVWDYVKDRAVYVVIHIGSDRYFFNFGWRNELLQFLQDPTAIKAYSYNTILRSGNIVRLQAFHEPDVILSPVQSRILLHKLFQVYEFTRDVSNWTYDDSPNVVF